MEKKIDRTIKEIMNEVPPVAGILKEFDIACYDCTVADCLLKDIVDIHNLPVEQEMELMYKLERAIYKGRDVRKPDIKRAAKKAGPKSFNYSPPLKKLVNEHLLIKKWIALIPRFLEYLDIGTNAGRKLVIDGVDFIRTYADAYHHAKEEKILFSYFDESLDIIQVILKDHATARGYTAAILEALESDDKEMIAEKFTAYAGLLKEHIKKEDEVLYPWMDRNLTTRDIGELYSRFNAADDEFGKELPGKYERFVSHMKEYISAKGAI